MFPVVIAGDSPSSTWRTKHTARPKQQETDQVKRPTEKLQVVLNNQCWRGPHLHLSHLPVYGKGRPTGHRREHVVTGLVVIAATHL